MGFSIMFVVTASALLGGACALVFSFVPTAGAQFRGESAAERISWTSFPKRWTFCPEFCVPGTV